MLLLLGLFFLVSSEMFWFLIHNFCNFLIIQTVSNFQFTTMLYLGQYFRFSALHWLHILLSLVSRFGIAVLFGVLYVYTGELFPTVIRSIVMGTVSVGARIGSIISPYLYDVVSNNLYLQLSYIKSLFLIHLNVSRLHYDIPPFTFSVLKFYDSDTLKQLRDTSVCGYE